MDPHLARVGQIQVHPQILASFLTRAIDTRHVVVMVVLLQGQTEPIGGVRSQTSWAPSSAPPYSDFPISSWPRVAELLLLA